MRIWDVRVICMSSIWVAGTWDLATAFRVLWEQVVRPGFDSEGVCAIGKIFWDMDVHSGRVKIFQNEKHEGIQTVLCGCFYTMFRDSVA